MKETNKNHKETDAVKLVGNINGYKSYLVLLNQSNLQEDVQSIVEFFVKKREWSCVYVNLNRLYEAIEKDLEGDIDMKKLFFIDAVEQDPKKKADNAWLVFSPSALTQIDLTITQIVQFIQSDGFVIVDSLDGLVINNNSDMVARFIRSVTAKVTKYNSRLIVIASEGTDKGIINKISPFFDKVLEAKEF